MQRSKILLVGSGAVLVLAFFMMMKNQSDAPGDIHVVAEPNLDDKDPVRTMALEQPSNPVGVKTIAPPEIAAAGPDPQPVPPGAGGNRSQSTANNTIQAPGTHISHGGPMGTVEIPNPPERLPGSGGSAEEVIAFETIRESMPNAYMVRESNEPPPGLVTEFPGEVPSN